MMARRTTGGFSLLELIVVMTLITILTSAMIPVFSGALSGMEGDQWGRDLTAAFTYAHERAMAQSREYRVYLSPETREFWVAALVGFDDGAKVFEELMEGEGGRRVLPDSHELGRPKAHRDRKSEAYYVAFFPNGASDVAEVVLINHTTGEQTRIETTGVLGNVEVEVS